MFAPTAQRHGQCQQALEIPLLPSQEFVVPQMLHRLLHLMCAMLLMFCIASDAARAEP